MLAETLPALAFALPLEAALGYPGFLYRAIGHPVTWMGAAIARAERWLNRDEAPFEARRAAGVIALATLLAATAAAGALATHAVRALAGALAPLALALLASSLIAQRSLYEHVARVAAGLRDGGLGQGREAVAQIVGRNPATLDEAGVCRAAIESLAENFSDGIVAPAFWIGLGGLTGGALYKAINTADSMVGHRTVRHAAYGWAAARLDDLANLPASRLAAALIVAAAALQPGASARGAFAAIRRDARKHRSPNAGWPEAAMAGALGLKLAGPRVYGRQRVEDHWMGDGRAEAGPTDIDRALALYVKACAILAVAAASLAGLALLMR